MRGCGRASYPTCLRVQNEQTAFANKPDVSIVARDNLSDTPDKRSIAVIAVVSECSGPWIKLVEAAIFSAKPQIAATVFGDALDRSTAERVRVVGVVKVSSTSFGCKIESIHPGVGGDPQIAVLVLHQILKEVGVQAARVVRVVLVYDEGVSVVAIETVSSGEPHEAPAILKNVDHIALRQAVVRGEMCESEIAHRSIDRLRSRALTLGGGGLCERRLPAAGGDQHDQHQPKRPAIRNPCGPDSCGTHRAIFLHNGTVRKF
jgi:hypothetical protein